MNLANFLMRYFTVALIGSVGIFFGLWTRVEDAAIAKPMPHSAEHVAVHGKILESNAEVGDAEASDQLESISIEHRDDPLTPSTILTQSTDQQPVGAIRVDSEGWLPAITQPINRADLTCSADGPLAAIWVAEGQEVKDGQKLALIDNRVAMATVEAARATAEKHASLRSARVKVTLARQYLSRLKVAASKNAASGVELDEAESRLEEALSQVNEGLEALREAEARLSIETARLNAHELVAPFSGTIVKIHKNVGETIGRDQVLISMVDVRKLRAEVFVPVDQISVLREQETVSLIAGLPGQPRISGTVVHIAPIIDAATRTVRAVVEIDNGQKALPSGFSILIDLSTPPSSSHDQPPPPDSPATSPWAQE
jgi:RND family efflux transporter MFP subunit